MCVCSRLGPEKKERHCADQIACGFTALINLQARRLPLSLKKKDASKKSYMTGSLIPLRKEEVGAWPFFFRVLAWRVCPYGGLEVLAVSPKGKSRDIQRRGGGGRQRRQPVADEAFRVSRPKEADNSLGVFLARSSCRVYFYV